MNIRNRNLFFGKIVDSGYDDTPEISQNLFDISERNMNTKCLSIRLQHSFPWGSTNIKIPTTRLAEINTERTAQFISANWSIVSEQLTLAYQSFPDSQIDDIFCDIRIIIIFFAYLPKEFKRIPIWIFLGVSLAAIKISVASWIPFNLDPI